jgi:hypothetical protein
VGRTAWTIIALAGIAVGAIFLARSMLNPAKEKAEQKQAVLNEDARPRVTECVVLDDADLPDGVERPAVGTDVLYVSVTIFYPDFPEVPMPEKHVLDTVNGNANTRLEPVHTTTELDPLGAYGILIYKTNSAFVHARLLRGEEVVEERVELE